ncbi:MAG TPA: polysaccharide deacetylase family protein [Xanthobacteraceae bacterium]|jgi:peptidoglycan/xylan/chitin deacetylase (PgdA/CDA1 family)|nr:polysaccharide deacetylase family protein [Xanthobacteraceae bacterium]
MRVAVIVIAALMTLGLAAFGIVAQKTNGPISIAALVARIVPADQTKSAQPLAATSQAATTNQMVRVAQNPVNQISDASTALPAGMPAPVAPSAPALTPAPAPLVVAQNTASALPAPAAAPPAPSAAPSGASAATTKAIPACSNPDALGLSRVVEIDTTGGPAFGTEHFKQYDFLRDKEIVFTFDDGPWPENTPAVLKALTDNCTKATFFEIGEHATWRPDISRQVAEAGMTIGTHTWSHKDLAKNPYAKDIEKAKDEVEMGVSAVHMAVNGPVAPFFRFPDLQMPSDVVTYLGTRNIATFSTDIDSFDFKMRKPEDVIKSVMTKLAKNGKGIILMHDFQRNTAEAMPELLHQLKLAGYKVVHMVPKQPVTTISKYDDMVRTQDKFSSSNNTRPESSVVKTISE